MDRSPLLRLSALAGSTLVLASCGGQGESPSRAVTPSGPAASATTPEEQAGAAAVVVINETDTGRICSDLISRHFLEALWRGSRKRCIARTDDGGNGGGTPRLTGVEVDGDRATVGVRVDGGKADGVDGDLMFVREDGGWRLDRYGADYLRSSFGVALRTVDSGAVAYPPLRTCAAAKTKKLSGLEVRRIMTPIIRQESDASDGIVKILRRCPVELAGYVTDRIVGGLRKEETFKPKLLRCLEREMPAYLAITGISVQLVRPDPSGFAVDAAAGVVRGVLDGPCKDA